MPGTGFRKKHTLQIRDESLKLIQTHLRSKVQELIGGCATTTGFCAPLLCAPVCFDVGFVSVLLFICFDVVFVLFLVHFQTMKKHCFPCTSCVSCHVGLK